MVALCLYLSSPTIKVLNRLVCLKCVKYLPSLSPLPPPPLLGFQSELPVDGIGFYLC